MIEARALSRRFGGREVVRGVSFRVEPGEVVGFLGPNGAGKTTTMRMLLGLLRADAGDAVIGGAVGFLPEVFTGYDAMGVRAYLRFMAAMKQVPAADVDRVTGAADLDDLVRRPIGRLSKGQRQRVGMAQALLGRPPAYVLDEPTQGLDPKQVVDARRLVRSLAEQDGAAVLLSTHLLAEAAAVCDRVVVIAKGKVMAEERPGSAPDLEERFLRLVGEAELQ
ncbi:MAG: gliding motility-associated transport system ATP-binding protein [Actinomycetota bacterium]|nr:gliding motility-associated transport system ATP-binding protein [Actinomycetota bacterium]